MKLIPPPPHADQAIPVGIRKTFHAPPDVPSCDDAETMFDPTGPMVYLWYQPDEEEVRQMVLGKPLMLIIWGIGMPPVSLGVDDG